MDLEDEEAEKRAAELEERRKLEMEDPKKDAFIGPDGKPYDPKKKFGIIEDNKRLTYDDKTGLTTSYEVNLPTEYYHDYVRKNLPKKEDGEWYIRPHHIESLTEHTHSIKADVLNTRYYSHYNTAMDKKPVKDTR